MKTTLGLPFGSFRHCATFAEALDQARHLGEAGPIVNHTDGWFALEFRRCGVYAACVYSRDRAALEAAAKVRATDISIDDQTIAGPSAAVPVAGSGCGGGLQCADSVGSPVAGISPEHGVPSGPPAPRTEVPGVTYPGSGTIYRDTDCVPDQEFRLTST